MFDLGSGRAWTESLTVRTLDVCPILSSVNAIHGPTARTGAAVKDALPTPVNIAQLHYGRSSDAALRPSPLPADAARGSSLWRNFVVRAGSAVLAIAIALVACSSHEGPGSEDAGVRNSVALDTAALVGCYRVIYLAWRSHPEWEGPDPTYKEIAQLELTAVPDSTLGGFLVANVRELGARVFSPEGSILGAWRGLSQDSVQVVFGTPMHESLVMRLNIGESDTLRGIAWAQSDVLHPVPVPESAVTLVPTPCAATGRPTA